MRSTVPARVVLAVFLVVSGRAGLPPTDAPETGSDVRAEVTSDHDRASVVTVGVAPAGHAGLTVEFVNGTVTEYPDAASIEDLPESVVPRVVSLRPSGESVQTRIYRWDGPQGATATFSNVSRNATVFYSIAYPTGDEPMRTLGRLTCGPDAELTTVELRINAGGDLFASNTCSQPS